MKVFLLVIGLFQMVVGCAGESSCSSKPGNFAPCDVDHQICAGAVACRSCNSALGLWALEPAWYCGCEIGTLDGRTGLYWQCALPPACTPGSNTFTDSQCTIAVRDAGSR